MNAGVYLVAITANVSGGPLSWGSGTKWSGGSDYTVVETKWGVDATPWYLGDLGGRAGAMGAPGRGQR